MKDFIKTIGLTLLSIFILLVGMDMVYTYSFKNGIPRNKVQKILQSDNLDYEYAFFGSSRTESHIDCELIEEITGESCINFGISGSSLGDMLVLIKLAQAKKLKINKIVLQVDHSFNRTGTTQYLKSALAPFMNEPVIEQEFLKENNSFMYKWFPFYRYMVFDRVVGFREVVATVIEKKPRINMSNGFSPKEGTSDKLAGNYPREIALSNPELQEIAQIAQDLKAELILFTAPFCKEAEPELFQNLLQQKLPNLHNYASLFDNNPEYFFDCGHLNAVGAREFTRTLTMDVLIDE